MEIETILVGPHGNGFVLHAEVMGFKYTGYFGDIIGFAQAVSEMLQFFAVKTGKMPTHKQTLSKLVLNA